MGVGPNNEKVAVKFERHGTRCPQLRHEYKVYRELTNCHGFCNVYHFGTQDNYNVMVMDLLGPSLEDMFNKCSRRFSLKTVLQIADQMLERADTLHSRHLIHRDIKPANFVIGTGDQAANIFCVDFGLSKRYRHPKNLHHIPHRDGRSLTGTPRYASINNHLGIEQSRRDDLESIGYVLVYFLKGTLPWQGLKAKNAQKKYRLIMEKKQQVSIAQLCQGCPSQFAEFLAYTRSLKFDAKPDIPYLRKLFRDLYHAQGCGSIPKLWDWDGMEGNDFLDAGSTGGPAPTMTTAANPLPSMMRPNTAAAVATGGIGGLDNDNMGTGSDANDELDDYEVRNTGNPEPHLRPQSGGYNRGIGVPAVTQPNNTSSWGYSRQQLPQSSSLVANNLLMQKGGTSGPIMGGGVTGLNDYGTEERGTPTATIGQRRPHTANGQRAAGFPTASQPMPSSGYDTAKQAVAQYNDGGEEDGDGHVVAGARGMMRYRRNRASTMEGGGAQNHPSSSNPTGSQMPQQQQQQQLLPSSIGYGAGASASGAPWTAMYQGSAGMKASGATSGVVGGGSSGLLGAAAAGDRGGRGGGGPPNNAGI